MEKFSIFAVIMIAEKCGFFNTFPPICFGSLKKRNAHKQLSFRPILTSEEIGNKADLLVALKVLKW
jgi:hypothetical protein